MKTYAVLALLAVALSARHTEAQVFLPVAPEGRPGSVAPAKKTTPEDTGAGVMATGTATISSTPSSSTGAAGLLIAANPAIAVCATPPQLTDISGGFKYNQMQLTTAQAAKAGLPVFGGSFSSTQQIVVREWYRVRPCLGTDGKTVIYYGQTIRTMIAVNNLDAKADLSLAALAANATLTRKGAAVSIDVQGLSGPKIDKATAELAGKELTVETFSEFSKVQGVLQALLYDSETALTVERIGIQPEPETEADLAGALARSFALYQLKTGASCLATKNQFPAAGDPGAPAIIESVYDRLGASCDASTPHDLAKARAKAILKKLEIKLGY